VRHRRSHAQLSSVQLIDRFELNGDLSGTDFTRDYTPSLDGLSIDPSGSESLADS
jgi:hypothetical protein